MKARGHNGRNVEIATAKTRTIVRIYMVQIETTVLFIDAKSQVLIFKKRKKETVSLPDLTFHLCPPQNLDEKIISLVWVCLNIYCI